VLRLATKAKPRFGGVLLFWRRLIESAVENFADMGVMN
jgi:hypothetical protein